MGTRINAPKPQPPSTINQLLQATIRGIDNNTAPMDCWLHFSAEQPLAVILEFRPAGKPATEWEFARTLLADGLEYPSGDGDVYIARDDDRYISILLSSPEGTATATFRTAGVRAFLDRTVALVQFGDEPEPDITSLENMLRAAAQQTGDDE